MDTKLTTLFLLLLYPTFLSTATGQTTNAWSNLSRGTFKWETASDWSLGLPPSQAQDYTVIDAKVVGSGRGGRTVSIDATTVLSNAINGCLTVQNFSIVSPVPNLPNTLFLNNAGSTPLTVLDSLSISNGGIVSITNSSLQVGASSGIGSKIADDGTMVLDSGTIDTDYGLVQIGRLGQGTWTVNDGTWLAGVEVEVGLQSGTEGTLTIAGGTSIIKGDVFLGLNVGGIGTIWMTGGLLTNGPAFIGGVGVGQMTVSNGTWQCAQLDVGYNDLQKMRDLLGAGTLTIAGGTNAVFSIIQIGGSSATGVVWMTGGRMLTPSTLLYGQMTISNGTWLTDELNIGSSNLNSSGTLTVAGGTSVVSSNLTIGTPDCKGKGTVIVTGGSLLVTNATHNAVLDLENSTLTLSGGTLVADIFVTTNPCASFQQTGGTLIVGGVTNLFAPLPFQITSITIDVVDIFIWWQTPGGVTNIIQATNGNPDGSYNTNFVDVSFPLIIGSPGTYPYRDVGGATNKPSRFYRVKLVP